MSDFLSPAASWHANQLPGTLQYLQHLRPDLPVYWRQTLPNGTTQVAMTGPAALEAAKGESTALKWLAGGTVLTGLALLIAASRSGSSDEPKLPKRKLPKSR